MCCVCRFTAYREQAETLAALSPMLLQQQHQLQQHQLQQQQQRQASLKNLQLAQQMATRPSVLAALRLKKRSLKQRLGPSNGMNVKSRLGTGVQGRVGTSPVLRGRLGLRLGYSPRAFLAPRRGRGFNRGGLRQTRGNANFLGQFRRGPMPEVARGRRLRGGGRPNRQQLDTQLDSYMARTRSYLDAELDAYMSRGPRLA